MRRNCVHTAVLTAALLAAGSNPLHAQMDAVEGLFEEVNALTIFYQGGWVTGGDRISGDLNGAGLEVLIELVSGTNTTLELGLGASYLRGYEADDDLLDLHTSVRALPTVTLYASRARGAFAVYGGVSFGLVDLWNAQAYDTAGQPWSVDAQTFELGASLGSYWTGPAGIGFFLEGGYRDRRFPSLKWTVPDSASLPEEWRSLNLSGVYAQAGIQLRVKELDRNEVITPPAPAGIWTLARMDGADLPGTRDSSTTWTQVLHGVLRLEPSKDDPTKGSWTLMLDQRTRTEPSSGEGPPTTSLGRIEQSGTYVTAPGDARRKHILTLTTTQGGTDTFEVERLAGRLYANWENHVLVFSPGNAEASADEDS